MRRLNPARWLVRLVDRFEVRGLYVPGEDSGTLSPWQDFGWIIAGWLVTVGMFVVFFALAT